MTHDISDFAVAALAIIVVVLAHQHLRMEHPGRRVVLGCAGLCLTLTLFFATVWVMPRPASFESTPFREIGLFAAAMVTSALFVLSGLQILGGSWQGLKRWRYYRRIAREAQPPRGL